MLICSKWQFQSIDGWGGVLNIIFYKQNKTLLPFFFTNFLKKVPNASTLERIPSENGLRVPGFRSRSAVFIGENNKL